MDFNTFFQIPFAAFVAVWLRANLLVTVVSTLISNPFICSDLFFAYQVGSLLIGETQVVDAQNTGHEDNLPDNLDTDFYAVVVHFFHLASLCSWGWELWQLWRAQLLTWVYF